MGSFSLRILRNNDGNRALMDLDRALDACRLKNHENENMLRVLWSAR